MAPRAGGFPRVSWGSFAWVQLYQRAQDEGRKEYFHSRPGGLEVGPLPSSTQPALSWAPVSLSCIRDKAQRCSGLWLLRLDARLIWISRVWTAVFATVHLHPVEAGLLRSRFYLWKLPLSLSPHGSLPA